MRIFGAGERSIDDRVNGVKVFSEAYMTKIKNIHKYVLHTYMVRIKLFIGMILSCLYKLTRLAYLFI